MDIRYGTQNNINFKGYDVRALKGLYVQGLTKPGEHRIMKELRGIMKKEGLDLFINENNVEIALGMKSKPVRTRSLSIWGQDRKAFVENEHGDRFIYVNSREQFPPGFQFGPFESYGIVNATHMPRGGNYYLGTNANGERWMLVNSISIASEESFEKMGDTPTISHLKELFGISDKNLYIIDDFFLDLDEVVRPIGFPKILVQDFQLALENVEKMKQKFPNSKHVYKTLKDYILKQIKINDQLPEHLRDKKVKDLLSFGFEPVRIAGCYSEDINFINAIAYRNNNDKISYITNSTKHSFPELEYLETLFQEDLQNAVPEVDKIYFVSGGKEDFSGYSYSRYMYRQGFDRCNTVMDILANRLGGVHCMCAEVPG